MRYVKLHHDRLQGLKGKQVPEGVKVCLVLGAKLRPDNSLSPILTGRSTSPVVVPTLPSSTAHW